MQIKDFKNYVEELKAQKEFLKNNNIKNDLLIDWFNKQIIYFENKLKDIEKEC